MASPNLAARVACQSLSTPQNDAITIKASVETVIQPPAHEIGENAQIGTAPVR
jgi:hypothetical protein